MFIFQDENLRITFQDKLNIKLDSLKLDNENDGWNNFSKIVCEAAGVVKIGNLEPQPGKLVKIL